MPIPESTQPDGTAAPRLLDVLRETLRVRHYSLHTEQQYVNWVRRFLRFHQHRHPREMGAVEVSSFLTHLAVEGQVSASTQNQALSALLFLYRVDCPGSCRLSGLTGEAWTWPMLSEQVLEVAENRLWLPDEQPLSELPCATARKVEVQTELESIKEFDRWQIPVGPGYARITRFTSSDYSIWHPQNATTVRKIVQGICTGRGYWNRNFQNWIVFRPFIQQVLEELAQTVESRPTGS